MGPDSLVQDLNTLEIQQRSFTPKKTWLDCDPLARGKVGYMAADEKTIKILHNIASLMWHVVCKELEVTLVPPSRLIEKCLSISLRTSGRTSLSSLPSRTSTSCLLDSRRKLSES